MSYSSFFDIAKDFKVIMLDSYGVVKNHKGLIQGVEKTINWIKSEEKSFKLLTNDASRSQEQQQQSLAQTAPALFGQQISALGALGTQQQAQEQALRAADQQLAFAQQQKPLNLAQQYGQGVMGLISGYPAQFQTQSTPTPSPLQTALGAGATLAGVYRAFS